MHWITTETLQFMDFFHTDIANCLRIPLYYEIDIYWCEFRFSVTSCLYNRTSSLFPDVKKFEEGVYVTMKTLTTEE